MDYDLQGRMQEEGEGLGLGARFAHTLGAKTQSPLSWSAACARCIRWQQQQHFDITTPPGPLPLPRSYARTSKGNVVEWNRFTREYFTERETLVT